MSRRAALGLGAGALLVPKALSAAAAPPVLVELFTSQGCSSCPPADRLAGELAAQDGVLVMTFNVDYWDYLGWRDTLARPDYSQRQYDYSRQRGDGAVYTPQMVVNGAVHVVGSERSTVAAALAAARKAPPAIAMEINLSARELHISLPESAGVGEATLWLMALEPQVKQVIDRGENAGESMTYHNVVRNLVPAAMWKGAAYTGTWMRDAVMPAGCTACVAVLQQHKVGPVLALARA